VSIDRLLMDGDEMAFHRCEVSRGYGQLEASVCVRLLTTACCLVGIRIWTHVGWRWMADEIQSLFKLV
jgi:hypothetical protein